MKIAIFFFLSRCSILSFCAAVLSPSAWAAVDAEWLGTVYCGARSDVTPIRPPYSLVLPKLIVRNGALRVESTGGNAVENWAGTVKDGYASITAEGSRSADDRWRYKFEGAVDNYQAFILRGAIYDNAGKQLRICTLSLHENITLPNIRGIPFVSDRTLMREDRDLNGYSVRPSPNVKKLEFRENKFGLSSDVVKKFDALSNNAYAKAIVLAENDKVYISAKDYVNPNSIFYTASIAKTVTSLAIGQAICRGYLKLNDPIVKYLPELQGKPAANASIRDLLMMASGFQDPQNNTVKGSGSILRPEDHDAYWRKRDFSFAKILFRDELLSNQKNLFFTTLPGSTFSYNNLNPMLLGLVVNRSTGVSYADWVQEVIFNPAGFEGGGFISQDNEGIASADGVFGLRLKISDWIRFATWVRDAFDKDDCLGIYLKEAASTQIKNGPLRSQRRTDPEFAGYGYLIWTEHDRIKDAFWAAGYGGQLIGWNKKNRRIILVMSNLENWKDSAVDLYDDWVSMKER